MSDLVQSNSWNGESGKHLAVDGTGERSSLLDVGGNWSTIRFLFRFLMSGPESNPSGPIPFVFIGVCEAGKPYWDANANAVGLVIGSTSFTYLPGDFGWVTSILGRKKVAAAVTNSTGNSTFLPRETGALSSIMLGFEIIKGSPNWTFNKLVPLDVQAPGHTVTVADGRAFHKVASESRELSGYRDFAHKTFGVNYLTLIQSHTVPEPTGTFDSFNLAWTFPATFGAVIQDPIITRPAK